MKTVGFLGWRWRWPVEKNVAEKNASACSALQSAVFSLLLQSAAAAKHLFPGPTLNSCSAHLSVEICADSAICFSPLFAEYGILSFCSFWYFYRGLCWNLPHIFHQTTPVLAGGFFFFFLHSEVYGHDLPPKPETGILGWPQQLKPDSKPLEDSVVPVWNCWLLLKKKKKIPKAWNNDVPPTF